MHTRRMFRILAAGTFAAVGLEEARARYTTANLSLPNQSKESNLTSMLSDGLTCIKRWFNEPKDFGSESVSSTMGITVAAESTKKITPWNWNWDDQHPSDTEDNSFSFTQRTKVDNKGDSRQPKANATRHLIFIRHGQYHYADDDAECHLTQLGHEQLNYTGMRLKCLKFPYELLHYSTMTRAIESTEEILKHLPHVQVDPTDGLREGAPYLLEPPLPDYRPSEATLKEEGGRIESAFAKHVHRASVDQVQDSYEIFVCHANVIRYFVCRALQLPPEAWIRFSLDHGSITWLVVRPDGRVVLRWLGNSGHMPPDKISVH